MILVAESRPKGPVILLADDDQDYQVLMQFALDELPISPTLFRVGDGAELLDFLRASGNYSSSAFAPRPDLIFLDLNMPRMGGREALKELKSDSALSGIDVVVMSTADTEDDQAMAYELGAHKFITKPASFSDLVQIMKDLLL